MATRRERTPGLQVRAKISNRSSVHVREGGARRSVGSSPAGHPGSRGAGPVATIQAAAVPAPSLACRRLGTSRRYNGRVARIALDPSTAGLLLVALALSGCGSQPPVEPTAYLAPAVTVAPSQTQPAVATVAAAPTDVCVNAAIFIEDLTVPDGTSVAPGERLDKRWAVQNSGSCDWGPGYRLVQLDSGSLGGRQEAALYPARAGENAVWQVELVAPEEPGEYLASWQARAPNGELFGEQVFVLIEVQR